MSTTGRRSLSRSLRSAASNAFQQGRINRRDRNKLFVASLVPSVLAAVEDALVIEAIQERVLVVPADGLLNRSKIDWDAILYFIERFIPLLLQIIDIFSGIPSAELFTPGPEVAFLLPVGSLVSDTGPSINAAVRVIAGRSCGSGSICGEDERGSFVLTNAHVAGTRVGRVVQVDINVHGRRVRKPAHIVMSAYSDSNQADWAVLLIDRWFATANGIEPVKLSTDPPSLDRSYYTMGSPNCVWPLVNTDIEPVDMHSNMPLWRWRPDAIGGQSGSGVWDDRNHLQYGLLTWSWQGLGAGQQTHWIWRQARDRNTDGPQRVEGLKLPPNVVPTSVSPGFFAEVNIDTLPIWHNKPVDPPADEGYVTKNDLNRLMRDLSDFFANQSKG